MSATVLAAEVEQYIDHLRVERRYPGSTLKHYARDLALLRGYADTLGLTEWAKFTNEQMRSFVAREHRRGLAPKSLQRVLSSCRGFFRFQARSGRLASNPADGVRAPKAPRKLPQVLDTDEVAALVEIPTVTPIGVRDRAMLELFYSSGLRLAELVALRWCDLDLDAGMARVTGKGAKTRIVPVGRMAVAALRALSAAAASAAAAPIFAGPRGRSLSLRAVQARIKYWARRQGVWKRVYPHLLRHSCASHMLESSGDLRAVQELLGHADIATTQVYTHLDFQHLARVYDAAHPRARRKRGG